VLVVVVLYLTTWIATYIKTDDLVYYKPYNMLLPQILVEEGLKLCVVLSTLAVLIQYEFPLPPWYVRTITKANTGLFA